MKNANTSGGGIGFFGALGILFIALKLLKVIDWSWKIVLMPIYLPIIVCIILAIIIVIINNRR